MITVPKKRLDDTQEWLLTNSLRSYSSLTILGHLTRKYHGLLIINNEVRVSTTDEHLILGDKEYKLTDTYYGNYKPEDTYHTSFSQDPLPTFSFSVKNTRITKSIALATNHNTVVVQYSLVSPEPFRLVIRPLVTQRHVHTVREPFILPQKKKDKRVALGGLRLLISHGTYTVDPHMYDNVFYPLEAERGYCARDALFNPGYFTVTGHGSMTFFITYTTERSYLNPHDVFHQEIEERTQRYIGNSRIEKLLSHAAGDFVTPYGIKAGYPWFDCYGRDTFISLPGLLLTRKQFHTARRILVSFAEKRRRGLLPNTITSSGVSYNSVDSSLWFIYAVYKYCQYTSDYHFVKKELWNTIEEILMWYQRGTDYDICMARDGLLMAGNNNTQLTWMDAQYNGVTFTSRHGKAVEINALWYNALCIAEEIGKKLDKRQYKDYGILAERVKFQFTECFWNGEYLNDTDTDSSLRPNQLFALSLPFRLLDSDKERAVLHVVLEELVTPMGLRSLNESHPMFQPLYFGDQFTRDRAYHNGTVWTWLLGPLITAYLRVNNHSKTSVRQVMSFIRVMESHMLREGCLGQISEIADGVSPFTARGCYAQAWSVGELLRVFHEDLGKK